MLAALAAGMSAGIPLADAVAAIEGVDPVDGRMSPHRTVEGVTIVDDSWKAPLYSAAPILSFLRRARAERKILVIGSLSDFPGDRARRYRGVARRALEVADLVALVGPWAGRVARLQDDYGTGRLVTFDTVAQLDECLHGVLAAGDLLVLKGYARADHLERILLERTASGRLLAGAVPAFPSLRGMRSSA